MRKGPRLQEMAAEKEILEAEILSKQKKLKEINTKIKAHYAKGGIDLTDHAIVRYMERRFKINIDLLKAEILTPELLEQMKILGGRGKFISGDYTFVIENNKIITVY